MDNKPAKAPIRGVIYALAAALLFGTTTPLAKTLLEHVASLMLSSLFYLGASLGLGFFLLVGLYSSKTNKREASLKRADLPWLCGATVCGGILAPVLLMTGLAVVVNHSTKRNSRKSQKKDGERLWGLLPSQGDDAVRPCARRAWAQRPATA